MSHQNPPNLCPVCKEEAYFKFIQDYKNKWGEWSLYQCSKCEVQFWLPFKNLGRNWYGNESRDGYEIAYLNREIGKPKIFRGYHKQFLKSFPKNVKNTKVLDLGCGTGDFIADLQKRGCEVWGVDFNKNAINYAKECFGLENIFLMPCDEFFQLSNLPKFDIITCFEIIEHLDNPLEFIREAGRLLKPEGIIVLSTPSRERLLVNLPKWDFPPNHLTRWNKKAISNLFKKINFKIANFQYVEEFEVLYGLMVEKIRFGLVAKVKKALKNKETAVKKGTTIEKYNLFIKIIRLGAHIKDYLMGGPPAIILFLVSKIMGHRDGIILVSAKK